MYLFFERLTSVKKALKEDKKKIAIVGKEIAERKLKHLKRKFNI